MSLETENFQLKNPVRVIYLLGLGHSGTTLLGRLLNAHSRVVATGGTKNIPLFLRGRKDCACGATQPAECPFWSRVEAELGKQNMSLASLDVGYDARHLDGAALRRYFEAVLAASGSDVIVDTSRRGGYFQALAKVDGVTLIPVHIFKDPRAQCASMRRKGRTVFPAIWNYRMRSRRVRALGERFPGMLHVSYEGLCRDPRTQLGRIMQAAGLELEAGQLTRWGETEVHILGGNRQRRNRSSEIRLDESWRQRLNGRELALVNFTSRREHLRNLAAAGIAPGE